MTVNHGKMFEKDFSDSVPQDLVYWERYKDGTASWSNDSCQRCGAKIEKATRFQAKNICDFEANYKGHTFKLELKSHAGKSIPLNCIRDNQISGLAKASRFPFIHAGLVINMRDVYETWYLRIQDFQDFLQQTTRKSIPISYMREKGIFIRSSKKISRYRYDVIPFLVSAAKKDK